MQTEGSLGDCPSGAGSPRNRLGPRFVRRALALSAGLLLVTAWLLPGRGSSSLSAPPALTVALHNCSGLWCRPHRDKRACIHSGALAWPWDTYPTVEFVGMRRTQSCIGEPDFDGPKEVVHRCTGPVVFGAAHPVFTNSDEAGGFCCEHVAAVNVAVTDVVLRLDDYTFLISDLKLGECHIRWEQMSWLVQGSNGTEGTRHTCGLSGAFGAEERSLTFSFTQSAVAASGVGMGPAVTCPSRILRGLLDFATGAGVLLLFMCLILSRSNPIG